MLWWTLRSLKSKSSNTRMHAVEKLGASSDPGVVDPLIATLQDQDGNVRGAAAKALGRIGDSRAATPLLEVLKDADPSVRSAAAEAVGKLAASAQEKGLPIPASPVTESLTALLTDDDHGVQAAALTALEPFRWEPRDEAQHLRVSQIRTRLEEERRRQEVIESERRLIEAASAHQLSTVRELIEAGVEVNAKDSDGVTALIAAARTHRPEMSAAGIAPRKAVLEGRYLNEEQRQRRDALQELMLLLIQAAADVNAVTNDGWTALALSARSNYIDTLQTLIEGGADVNLQNQGGKTALLAAVVAGNVESVEVLIAAGADVNWKDTGGYSLIYYAEELFKSATFGTMERRKAVLDLLRSHAGFQRDPFSIA